MIRIKYTVDVANPKGDYIVNWTFDNETFGVDVLDSIMIYLSLENSLDL